MPFDGWVAWVAGVFVAGALGVWGASLFGPRPVKRVVVVAGSGARGILRRFNLRLQWPVRRAVPPPVQVESDGLLWRWPRQYSYAFGRRVEAFCPVDQTPLLGKDIASGRLGTLGQVAFGTVPVAYMRPYCPACQQEKPLLQSTSLREAEHVAEALLRRESARRRQAGR